MSMEKDINKLRHSAAHLLAHAVTELYPDTKPIIGPPTTEGFFFDFLPHEMSFKEKDLPLIEAKMLELAEQDIPIEHSLISKEEARKIFKNNSFKLELIDGIPENVVGLAKQGTFLDLCKGGHVHSTGELKNFKLLSISGSYWRGDRKNQPLQRISGTAFFTPKELRIYETRIEEAQKYDHRKLGRELDLFSFHDEGPGFPFYHPHGKVVLNKLTEFSRKKQTAGGYKEISTPSMLSDELWQRSGHYAHYKDNMYFSEIDERSFAIKPMNCPGSILIFKERPRSYRELPLRLAEYGQVHRYELSGALHGLFRVRAFTQDDAHIYCTQDQLPQELANIIKLTLDILRSFGFEKISVGVSTKPEKAMGDDALWQKATNALIDALKEADIPYTIFEGDGAFYGPKIDFNIEDSMGRPWQCGTTQVDFFQPENFDLTYIANDGTRKRPIIIHRAVYGSLERFLGILLEHYKGRFPFWLAPVQIKVLTITDEQKAYGEKIRDIFATQGYRVTMDESSDPISGKIKVAQAQQIPWMFVVGAKEQENNTITLRHRDGKQEFGLTIEQLITKAQEHNG